MFKPLAMKTVNSLAGCGEVRSMSNRKKSLEGYAFIGKRIQVRRKLFGLGDKEFAEKVGITVYMLKKYETGESEISALKLIEIAKELEVPFSYFFQEN